jgi:hypothetical protein
MKYLAFALIIAVASPAIAQQTPPPPPDPVGGYAPSEPPMRGTPQPGSPIIFQPSVSPSVAFPPPPPLAHYPNCSRTRTDHCLQPNDPK